MPAIQIPGTNITYGWQEREDGWSGGMNTNLVVLGYLARGSVLSRSVGVPPADPDEGDRYIVPVDPSGEWAGHDNEVAMYLSGAWIYIEPFQIPMLVIDEDVHVYWNGAQYVLIRGTEPAAEIIGLVDVAVEAAGTAEAAAEESGENRQLTASDAEQTAEDRQAVAADRLAAESAAESAARDAQIYPDTATALASTTEGDYFSVPSPEDDEAFIIYRHDTGPTATEVKRTPSKQKFKDILLEAPAGYAYSIVDRYGRMAFGVTNDGDVRIETVNGKPVDEWLQETLLVGALVEPTPAGYAYGVIDRYGRMAFGITDDGEVQAKALSADTLNGVSVSAIISGDNPGQEYRRRYPSEVSMVLSYGQSLSVGADGTPAISTSQRFDNLMFAGGVRSQDSGEPYTSLVPLVEGDASTLGETPIAGATESIKELIANEDGLAYTDHNFQLLGSAPGAGGTAIAGLSTGTGPYNRFVADVQAGFDLAQAAEKSFKVGAFFWTQAESDYINDTPAATYKAALVALRNDLEADVQAITGQLEPLACISYQVQGHATYGYPGDPYLAVAQLEVARENTNHYVACPLYWSPQSVHQSAANYKRLGAYYGLAYKRIVIDGEDWRPVEPLQVDHQGAIILIRFNVPVGSLVLDNALHPAQPDYGFSVVDSGGAAVTINSVNLIGPDTVKIVTASEVTGGRVQYGYLGDGGNLRDSQGDTIVFDPEGLNFPLHNWCVIFNEPL